MMITLTTDFGLRDAFVGIMKGVIANINPNVAVVDLTHGIPPQNVVVGALALRQAARFFPPGTIHVAVVDPGVGSARRPLLVQCGDTYFVGPDNGLLSLAAGDREPDAIICLSNPDYHLTPASATFHGRDVFAPVAAHLSRKTPAAAFGDKLDGLQTLQIPAPAREAEKIRGEIIYIDHFGNLFTNIAEPDFSLRAGEVLEIALKNSSYHAAVATNYAAAMGVELVALCNSWGVLEIAVPSGNAQQRMSAKLGDPVSIRVVSQAEGK